MTSSASATRSSLQLNTLGDAETRSRWREALVGHFRDNAATLSRDSLERLEKNPLRILDSKDPADRALVATAPGIDAHMTAEAGAFFEAVQKGLQAAGVAFVRAPALVRGLRLLPPHRVRIRHRPPGRQGTVIGGGRYDGLIEAMGGPHTPAVGWAAGIERLAMLVAEPRLEQMQVAIIPMRSPQKLRLSPPAPSICRIAAEQALRGNLKKRLERSDRQVRDTDC